jgi:hypothetical protein
LRGLSFDVSLSRTDETKEIYFSSEERLKTRDKNQYMQAKVALGLTLRIDNKLENRIRITEVWLLHPNESDFVRSGDGVYTYPGAILPGQSFAIAWEPIDPAPA